MISLLKENIKRTPISSFYILAKKNFAHTSSQSNEAEILAELVRRFNVPRSFVEFGFSGWEFNCIDLARSGDWEGLLLDGYAWNIRIARLLYPPAIQAREMWIDLDTIGVVDEFAAARNLGILSIDVDGNDYWFLNSLIHHQPAIIVSEFNTAMKMRPITVPYDPRFDRFKKHASGEYYGASLKAISLLCEQAGYSLLSVSSNQINAFFVRNDLLGTDTTVLSPEEAWSPKIFPDGRVAAVDEKWQKIEHLPFVRVAKEGAGPAAAGEIYVE